MANCLETAAVEMKEDFLAVGKGKSSGGSKPAPAPSVSLVETHVWAGGKWEFNLV